ncbi:hypothetical protein SteCoe_15036 [Stentor coeruleus]|uniref:Palmitoyltransferase n=1 Tax=Stentor coeruleus TaxID=5963 RepID=A0A1R2C4N3_9CILI|nr:hypothetical protein SteCoe_15036 [Stentor coeruleus]
MDLNGLLTFIRFPSYRSHGFEWPPNIYQVLISSDLIVTIIFSSITHLNDDNLLLVIIYALLYYTSLFFVVYYWFKSSVSNPTDPVVIANRLALIRNMPFDSSRYENICTICNTSVGDNSKHCGTCNKCVEGFDHHCIWLNNCIGKINYKLFIKLIISLLIHEFIIIAASIRLILMHFSSENIENVSGINTLAVEFFLLIQGFVISFFLLNLLLLHIWLYKNEMTTYELIKRRNKKSKRVQSVDHTEVANSKVTVSESPKFLNDNN